MEESKASQSFSINGGQFSNFQFGGQAGRDLNAIQSQQTSKGTVAQLTPAEIAALLDQLMTLLQTFDLSANGKATVVRSIEMAKEEVQADKPDKDFAAKSLQRATAVLKDAGETVEAGSSLWQKVKPILEIVGPWLGVAVSFFV